MSTAWKELFARVPPEASSATWRTYSDQINRRLVENWLGLRRFGRALKTDSFEAAVGEGLVGTLEQYAQQVVWMDGAPPAVCAARKRHAARAFVAADVRRLPFRDGSFGLIFSGSTLDHFDCDSDFGAALAGLARRVPASREAAARVRRGKIRIGPALRLSGRAAP